MNTVINNIQTRRKPVVLEFGFSTSSTAPVYFVATDAQKKCVYFNREYIPVSAGDQSVELTLPVSAEQMQISVFSQGHYSLNSMASFNMQKRPFSDADAEEFMALAETIACNFQNLSGDHKSKSGRFTARFVGDIKNEEGYSIPTPMQVDHLTADVSINKNLVRHYTAQSFVVALLHENTHYKYNTKDEIACDLNAARIAVDRGYMKTEIMKAFTSVLSDDPLSIARTNALDNFLLNYPIQLK